MTTTAHTRKTLRRDETAVALGLSKVTIDRMVRSGELASFKQGRSRLIVAASVDEWMARKQGAAA